MRRIIARFKDRGAFLGAYQWNSQNGGLFITTEASFVFGEFVMIETWFSHLVESIDIQGVVVSLHDPGVEDNSQKGVKIVFFPAQKRKRDLLLAIAQGQDLKITPRVHVRHSVKLAVRWRLKRENEHRLGMLEDVSEGGAFVRTDSSPPKGSKIILDFKMEKNQRSVPIEGVVAWQDQQKDLHGMGISFNFEDHSTMQKLKVFLSRISQD